MKDQSKQSLFDKLKQLGFKEQFINKAIDITHDIQKASQIILKLEEEGPQANLSGFHHNSLTNLNPTINFSEQPTFHLSDLRTKMLFVVNGELKMGKGKICAQVGHAVIGAYLQIQQEAKYDERSKERLQNWNMQGTPKVVVKVQTQAQMLYIKKNFQNLEIGMNMYLVQDAGHTQIKAGSKTVLGIGPAYNEQIDQITGHLKLL